MIGSHGLRVARGDNDVLVDDGGQRFIDLFSAHGATWLGHANPAVVAAVRTQLEAVWLVGALETAVAAEAAALVDAFVPASHRLVALYSTGMEAAEFAMRLCRVATGRIGLVGFERSLHGKSLATASLGWDNRDGVTPPLIRRLPFVPAASEDVILARLAAALAATPVSAVFVEPLQGTGGGHAGSPAFYAAIARACRDAGALSVFDEILTGFHRTGPAFWFSDLGFVPDVVLLGKAMGNGFPVSGVVARRDLAIVPAMLPGSTYAGNPLAAAAVAATLREMGRLDLPACVAAIEASMRRHLAALDGTGAVARGRGAMWVIELPPAIDVEPLVIAIYRAGVAVGAAGRYIRLLPPVTITPAHLDTALGTVVREVRAAASRDGARG